MTWSEFSATLCNDAYHDGGAPGPCPTCGEGLPTGEDGVGYLMWVLRYKRGDAFEEIHIPRYDRPGEARAVRTRARALADEVAGAVAYTEACITATYGFTHLHPATARPLWQVEFPRSTRGPEAATAWKVVECPNCVKEHPA